MATFTSIIEDIKHLSSFSEKTSFLTLILNSFQDKKVKITLEDKRELSTFAFEEINQLLPKQKTRPAYNDFQYH